LEKELLHCSIQFQASVCVGVKNPVPPLTIFASSISIEENSMKRSLIGKFSALLTFAGVLLCVQFGNAQGIVTGSISGTVLDPQGAVVAGAKVTARHVATNREFMSETTSAGIFTLRALPPGTYDVKIQATSFRSYESKGLQVNVGEDTSLGAVKMEIGAASETLTVEGSAPLIEATTQQITNTFESQKVQDIPLGNSMDSFALFVPGVATAGDASFSNTNGAELAVNGQRARSNNYQIDGQANNDNSVGGPSIFFGNQDAIAELQIVTNYSAEYGRNMGAVVNYVTKSGTNNFHGSAYEFWQGSKFDSLSNQEKNPLLGFCMPGQSTSTGCSAPQVTGFVDNRFGGTAGGPILKDKSWFFFSTNFERQRTAGSPSNSGGLITPDPTGIQQLQTAFPNNPAVQALATIGPTAVKGGNPKFFNPQTIVVSDGTASAPVEFAEVNRFVPAPFNDREFTGRVDLKLSSKDNIFGRYVFQQQFFGGISGTSIAQGDWIDEPGRDQQIGVDWVRNFSTNFINQVRASYSRVNFGFQGGSFPNCVMASITNCPTSISFGDGTTLGVGRANNLPQGRIINVIQGQDNASWQHGRMTLKMGGEWTHQLSPNVFLPNVNGTYTFPDFDSFLANQPDALSIVAGNPHLPFVENDLAAYLQDDWRVSEKLTLNLGLRWEWFQQAINLLHDRTVAQQTGPNPFWDTSLPLSQTTIPHIPQALHNFSPVVGFAYSPFGNSSTVIRGGFRIGYDPQFYNMFLNTATRAPVVNSGQFPNATVTSAPGLPSSGAFGTDVQAAVLPLVPTGGNPGSRPQTLVTRNFHNPYSEQWNFGIQHAIKPKIVAEIRYVGNHTVGNFQSFNGNPALRRLITDGFSNVIPAGLTPCSDSTAPGYSQGYVNCNLTRVVMRGNTAYSNYNGLQTELRVAQFHGVTATASYTWSKTIDNASEVYSTAAGGNTLNFAQNPFDISSAERGLSGIDFPHLFGLAFIYEIPFYKHQQGLVGHVLGGWQMNTTYRYTFGQPYTTIESRFAGSGTSLCDPTGTMSTFYDACRPIVSNPAAPLASIGICTDPTLSDCGIQDYVSGAATNMNAVRWIVNDNNAAKFFGTPFKGIGRNTLRGQPISTVNLSMLKDTKLTEKLTFQFRATAYNLLNTQFRGVPDPLLDDVFSNSFQNTNFNANGGGTFAGNINTDGIGIRRLEFGAKLIF
jgi:hypothetical protein